ncbi:unnamed protein product, partial [Closterium sp. Naga37s-1]
PGGVSAGSVAAGGVSAGGGAGDWCWRLALVLAAGGSDGRCGALGGTGDSVAKSTGGRAGKRRDWRMLALAAATPFPLSSSPPLRPSLFPRHGAARRQRDSGGSIGGLARGPVGGFVGGRADTRACGSVGGLVGALVGGSDGGSVGGFAGALVGGTDGGSVGGFAGGSVGVLAGGSDPGVPGGFLACAVACVAGSARATG